MQRVAVVALALFTLVRCSRDPVTSRLADDPAARALRASDHAAFAALEAHMRASAPGDVETADAFEARLRAYLRTSVLPAYAPLASDAAIAEHAAVTTTELEELRDRSYHRCHAFLFGDVSSTLGPLQLEGVISTATRLARSRATVRLIDSAGSGETIADASSTFPRPTARCCGATSRHATSLRPPSSPRAGRVVCLGNRRPGRLRSGPPACCSSLLESR